MRQPLRDIEYFAEVAAHGNVARAAEAIGLSQPALSKSLRRLETFMQAKLVKRLSKGVELTAVGHELHSHVQRLRLSVDDMMRAVADLAQGRAGHLRIRAGPGTGSYLVPLACAALLKEVPHVTFTVSDMVVRERTIKLLRDGELDIAIAVMSQYKETGLTVEHLYDETYRVYAREHHRLAGRKKLPLAELTGEKWTVSSANADAPTHLKRSFLTAGLPLPVITLECPSMQMRHLLVANSEVLAFTPRIVGREAMKHHKLVQLPIPELNYARRIGVYHRNEAYLPTAARRFIEVLKKTAREVVVGIA